MMEIKSNDFQNNEQIPQKFTQFGENISPEILISDIPESTASIVLICSDPDAPDPANPQRTFTHWVVYNLPGKEIHLLQGEDVLKVYPEASYGLNDRGSLGYIGPRPPIGTHRYFFRAYALTERLKFKGTPSRQEVLNAMDGLVLGSAEIIGLYPAP